MNYHSDEWIMNEINNHHQHALSLYLPDQIVGIFYQGSGNYGLDYENSDVDTKCILTPTFKNIALNHQPVSTTHVLPNEAHLDAKDFRLYCKTFLKQNINFVEILFTDYQWVNPMYAEQWNRLVEAREAIAHYSPRLAIKAMYGMMMEKHHAMTHRYPAKADIIEKHGYDGKQLSHLLRISEFLSRYLNGEKYEDCLISQQRDFLLYLKEHKMPLNEAQMLADFAIKNTKGFIDAWLNTQPLDDADPGVVELLEDVQYRIMRISVEKEFENNANLSYSI